MLGKESSSSIVRGRSSTNTPAQKTIGESSQEKELNEKDSHKIRKPPQSSPQTRGSGSGRFQGGANDSSNRFDPTGLKARLEDNCAHSVECSAAKEKYEDCAFQVKSNNDRKRNNRSCIDEFVDLAHCVTNCVTERLPASLN